MKSENEGFMTCERCGEDEFEPCWENGGEPEYWECDHCGFGNHNPDPRGDDLPF